MDGSANRETKLHVKPSLSGEAHRVSLRGRRRRRHISYCGLSGCPGPKQCRTCRTIYMRAWREMGRERLSISGLLKRESGAA